MIAAIRANAVAILLLFIKYEMRKDSQRTLASNMERALWATVQLKVDLDDFRNQT